MLDRSKNSLFFLLIILSSGCNPFAPGLEDVNPNPDELLGNRMTIDGTFEWFQNAYELRDSTLYGQLLHPRFVFTYTDFETANNVQWDRQSEMEATYNLFQQVKNSSLQWNNYVFTDTTQSDTIAEVERSFNLLIVTDDQSVFRGTGFVRLTLQRTNPAEPWQILSWTDLSDF